MTVDDVAAATRRILLAECARVPKAPVAVLTSGGVDSTSVLLSLLLAGRTPVAYSFVMEGRVSTDFLLARQVARSLGVEFRSVILPGSVDRLAEDVRLLVEGGLRRKAEIECSWPRWHALGAVREAHLATGDGADGYFGVSRKATVRWSKDPAPLDPFRDEYLDKPNRAQVGTLRAWAVDRGVTVWTPWWAPEMREAYRGTSWADVNRPREKEPVRRAFAAEFARLPKLPRHTNLQLGDSGISAHFEALLATDLNQRGYRSVVGVYNALARGEV